MEGGGGEVAIRSDAHETLINSTNREDIICFLADCYEFNDDRLTATNNKPRPTGYTDHTVYKE